MRDWLATFGGGEQFDCSPLPTLVTRAVVGRNNIRVTTNNGVAVSDASEQPTVDPAIDAAAKKLVPGAPPLTPVGDRPFLIRTTVDGRDLRLRRWPDGTVPERVRFVNRLQAALAGADPAFCAAPYSDGPAGQPSVQIGGAMVDAQAWLPGHPSAERSIVQEPNEHTLHRPAELSPERLTALVQRVALMHDRTEPFTRERATPVATVTQLLRAIGQSWRLARVSLRPVAPQYPPIQRWLRLGEQILPAAEHAIIEANVSDQRPVIGHLSLWPAHALFDRAVMTGLIDFGAAVMTTPLLDVAQLAGRFPGWTGDHAELVVGHYTDVRQLSPDERRALPSLAAMDMVIEAARLLRVGYVMDLPPGSKTALAARAGAQDLLSSIDAVAVSAVRSVLQPTAKRRPARRPGRPSGHGDRPRKPRS